MVNKELLRARLSFIRQGSETERYHTKRMIQRNDVGHHSFHVAWLAWLMGVARCDEVNPESIVMAALNHDLAEHVTGDMPGDFKREMGLRESFSQYEAELFSSVGFVFENALSAEEQRILKLADMMEGCFFCIGEASLGNQRVGVIYGNYRGYLDHFAPFYEVESLIIEYIDDLWKVYGLGWPKETMGWPKGSAPGWESTSHRKEDTMQEDNARKEVAFGLAADAAQLGADPSGELIRALKREEAEGRATPAPGDDHSKPPKTEVPVGQEQPPDDTNDDRAGRDLPDTPQDESLPANARQYGGDHYKGTGYEHWDLVLDVGMNYFQGCATKYITRARRHSGGPDLNLLKAIHYVDKAQEAETQSRLIRPSLGGQVSNEYAAANQLNELEALAINHIVAWRWDLAREAIKQLRGGATEPEQPSGGRVYYGQLD